MFDHTKKINPRQRCLMTQQYNKMRRNDENRQASHPPVVKFFDPCGASTWLLSAVDEDGIAYGLCDLGQGFPEIGYVDLEELCAIGRINRDKWFDHKGRSLLEWKQIAETSGLVGV